MLVSAETKPGRANYKIGIVMLAAVGSVLILSHPGLLGADQAAQEIVHESEGAGVTATMEDGAVITGVHKNSVSQFLGIKFAEIKQRFTFSHLVPVTGHIDAIKFGPKCGQFGGSEEDCLFLNVYAPPNTKAGDNLNVMVWVHGGGNKMGAGSQYNPSHLVSKYNVIVVTLNYRLGVFGQFASELIAKEHPDGSNGGMNYLQDQVNAFKWVQRYISYFGGDKKKVTIFGESAGGYSVCSHLVSSISKGLFRRAIVESGGCNGPRGPHTMAYGEHNSQKCLKAMGCKDLACMRKVSGKKLATSPMCTGSITIDGFILKKNPAELLKEGVINLPKGGAILMGHNSADSLIGAPFYGGDLKFGLAKLNATGYVAQLKKYFPHRWPQILELYPADTKYQPNNAKQYVQVNADACFKCAMQKLAQRVEMLGAKKGSDKGAYPVFLYEYAYQPVNNPKTAMFEHKSPHAHELAEVFAPLQGETDMRLADMIQAFWTSFAKTGLPVAHDSFDAKHELVTWPRYEPREAGRPDTGEGVLFDIPVEVGHQWDVSYAKKCDMWEDAKSGAQTTEEEYEFCFNGAEQYRA